MNIRAIAALGAMMLLAPMASARPSRVLVQDVWARATPPGAATGVVYMQLTSPSDDRLTAIATPVAGSALLHRTVTTGGMMRMPPVQGGLLLPAGQPVSLHPLGTHVMLEGLTAPLLPGEHIKVHLIFEKAPPEDVSATVRPIGATGPDAPMAGMDMGK